MVPVVKVEELTEMQGNTGMNKDEEKLVVGKDESKRKVQRMISLPDLGEEQAPMEP